MLGWTLPVHLRRMTRQTIHRRPGIGNPRYETVLLEARERPEQRSGPDRPVDGDDGIEQADEPEGLATERSEDPQAGLAEPARGSDCGQRELMTPHAMRLPLLPVGLVTWSSSPKWMTSALPSRSKIEVGPADRVARSLVVSR